MWCLLIGGQYDVGTDYFAYLDYFSNGDLTYFEKKGDILFVNFIEFCNNIGIKGQNLFFLISFIWIIILIYITQKLVGSKFIYIYLFVFIVYSGAFHNQMNGIRQYCAIYIFTIAECLLLKKRYKTSCLLFIAMCFIHNSSIVTIPFAIITSTNLLKKINKRIYLTSLVILAFFFSLIPLDFLIKPIISNFGQYAYYYTSGLVSSLSLTMKITKYIYIPLVIYSIYLYPKMYLNEYMKKIYIIGICAYTLKLAFISMSFISRIALYFDILACIPIVFLLIHLRKSKHTHKKYLLLILYLLLPYILKVTILAKGEYEYHSIFLN